MTKIQTLCIILLTIRNFIQLILLNAQLEIYRVFMRTFFLQL